MGGLGKTAPEGDILLDTIKWWKRIERGMPLLPLCDPKSRNSVSSQHPNVFSTSCGLSPVLWETLAGRWVCQCAESLSFTWFSRSLWWEPSRAPWQSAPVLYSYQVLVWEFFFYSSPPAALNTRVVLAKPRWKQRTAVLVLCWIELESLFIISIFKKIHIYINHLLPNSPHVLEDCSWVTT